MQDNNIEHNNVEDVQAVDAPERNSVPGSDDAAPEQRDLNETEVTPEADIREADGSSENAGGKSQPDTFPRDYVEKLRRESAGYRERAKRVDELERRLHAALVKADGRLADPADLEFNVEHLDDADALEAAITDLVDRKPGLRARKYGGDVGAGKRGTANVKQVDLIELMRGN